MAEDSLSKTIRIEPDWNVKFFNSFFECIWIIIRIEPDWNVKTTNPVDFAFDYQHTAQLFHRKTFYSH